MFSVQQKRDIADKVQKILRETHHPELPDGEIPFTLHVDGAESWSWADIRNNGYVTSPEVNPWNEMQAAPSSHSEPELVKAARNVIDDWQAWNKDNRGEEVCWESLKKLQAALASTPQNERSPQDYAIEHGGYLANAAERYLEARNQYDRLEAMDEDGDIDSLGDHYRALKSAIHEFRKRAVRATSSSGEAK